MKTNVIIQTIVLLTVLGGQSGRTANIPVFTRVSTGVIATDEGVSAGCAWGDYNNDGYEDLFVASSQVGSPNRLYLNNRDGSFTKVSIGSIVTDGGNSSACVWGDFDNDGFLDLFVTNPGADFVARRSFLYRNNGDGSFQKVTSGRIATDFKISFDAAWADFDNDGRLDLYVGDYGGNRNALYRNNGDGTFTPTDSSPIVKEGGKSVGSAWSDYDNDGHPDLFVANGDGSTPVNNFLYRNKLNGAFERIRAGAIVNNGGNSLGCAWGDYDNDGFSDLFVCNGFVLTIENNFLYHNNGDGTFTRITDGNIATDTGSFGSCSWGDYDNDGFLDLFVTQTFGKGNVLYHNNGDGTFSRMEDGIVVTDEGNSRSCAWADYDNDGFLDLFVANDDRFGQTPHPNFLYRNEGNTNQWIKVKLVGTVSNRAAIGAKIRIQATLGGKSVWQLREISGGSGWSGQNSLVAHFGLREATNIDTVRIEWPSGVVQEMHNVAAKQSLTITEPPRWIALGTVMAWGSNGFGQTNVPIAAQNAVTSIAAGVAHSVALKNDGSVLAWGANWYGQTDVPVGAQSGVTAIAAGGTGGGGGVSDGSTVALKNDGTVLAWGLTSPTPPDLSGVTVVAAGGDHTVALKNDGSVVAWGNNEHGQLTGRPGDDSLASPVTLRGQVLSEVTAIAAGRYHTVALKNDGSVVAWGNNEAGQVTGTPGDDSLASPVILRGQVLSGVTAIAAGRFHTVALKNDGSVVAWGAVTNRAGIDLGYGQALVPVAAQGGVVAIAAGDFHTVALKKDGTMVSWGANYAGQVTGTPTTAEPYAAIASPVTLGSQVLSGVTAIAAGGGHTLALLGAVLPVPSLNVRPSGNALILSWPTNATGFTLQSAPGLTPPVTWIDSTDLPAVIGAQFTVTISASGAAQFYRLRNP